MTMAAVIMLCYGGLCGAVTAATLTPEQCHQSMPGHSGPTDPDAAGTPHAGPVLGIAPDAVEHSCCPAFLLTAYADQDSALVPPAPLHGAFPFQTPHDDSNVSVYRAGAPPGYSPPPVFIVHSVLII